MDVSAPLFHPAQVLGARIRLRGLTLWRWRNVVAGSRLDFADGLNLILGRNGTGKTHLLDLLSVLVRGDFKPLQAEEFDLAWEIEVEGRWQMELRARHQPARRRGESAQTTLEHLVQPPGAAYASPRRAVPGIELFSGALYTHLIFSLRVPDDTRALFESDLFIPCFRLDEHLDLFRAIIARTGTERFSVFSTGYEAARFTVSSGADFTLTSDLNPIDVAQGIWWLEPLTDRFVQGTGFYACDIRVRSTGGRPEEDEVDYHGIDLTFQPHARGPSFTQAEALSFGQKRFFAYLYLSLCVPAGPVLADELSNGLHHALIRVCIDEIGDRQAFLATQEPGLLNHVTLDSADAARACLIFCRGDAEGRWVWEKPSAAEAAEVFRAYEVGIQHLSDILLTQGLW